MDHRIESRWSDLSSDVAQVIFCKLPEASVLRAGSVCKRWYSVTQMPSFAGTYKMNQRANFGNKFVYKSNFVNYTFREHFDGKGGFQFQPVAKRYDGPTVSSLEDGNIPSIEAAGGLHVAFTGLKGTILRYKLSLAEKSWRTTPEVPFALQDPIVGVVDGDKDGSGHKLVVAGGCSAYVDDTEGLAVAIYDDQIGSWGSCDPLPSEFKDWRSSSFCLAAVVHQRTFYVYDIYSGLVTWLDLDTRRWSAARHLLPSTKVSQLFLVSRSGVLRLVGVQEASERDLSFTVWNVEDEFEETMRVGEIVHRSIILNAYGAPPKVTIPRWASSSVELSLTVLLGLLLLLVQLEINCFSAVKRVIRFLYGKMNSTATVLRKQFSTPKSGIE